MSLLSFFASLNTSDKLSIWASGDPHLAESVSSIGYNSISEPMQDLVDIGFDYDIALSIGDFAALQEPPDLTHIADGEQLATALNSQSNREKHYTLNGNHDDGDGNKDWWERYVDPLGNNTSFSGVNNANRPYPINLLLTEWYEGYYLNVGNLMIIMLPDRNELPIQYGRGGAVVDGGYPSGALSLATWNAFKTLVLANTNKNIWVCSHMNPRNTTIGTPDGDGVAGNFHSGTTGISDGAGSIYSIYDETTPANTDNATDVILDFFADNSHSVSLWMGGHTHTNVNETFGGKTNKHSQSGVQYLNIASLTKTWVGAGHSRVDSRSWTIEITGTNVMLRNYIHNPETAGVVKGFREDQEFSIQLKYKFSLT